MAILIVARFVCDICKTAVETGELVGTARKASPPKDWAEVVGSDKRKVLDIQICPSCITAIKNDNVKVTTKAKETS